MLKCKIYDNLCTHKVKREEENGKKYLKKTVDITRIIIFRDPIKKTKLIAQ